MTKFIIEGGEVLKGKISLFGAKNAGFKLMIASLLTDEECVLSNVPNIGDVEITSQIIKALGGRVEKIRPHTFSISSKSLSRFRIPSKFSQLSRSSLMFIGPLLARFGKIEFYSPGGDKIGRRPIDRLLKGLEAMGAKVKEENGFYSIKAKTLKGANYLFPKNTHTGTETLIMTAVLAKGVTILSNAACEPEVDDLINFLNKMGAKIKRSKPRTIKIEGVNSLHGASHQIMFDRNEAVTFACAALLTRGDIFVKNAQEKDLIAFLDKLKEIGGGVKVQKEGIRFYYQKELSATNIQTAPHPGFMTDWQPLWTVLMTQARGKSIIHETIYENRFGHVPYLISMGAKIEFFNPQVKNPEEFYNFNLEDDRPEYFHAIRIFGPTPLHGAKIKIPDIRAGATLLLAALAAKGKSVLEDVGHIERGYESLDKRLKDLGAKIKKIK